MEPKKVIHFIYILGILFLTTGLYAQETVNGKITDGVGTPIAATNIIVKGTSVGTVSDFDGNYSITASQGSTLVFSSLGFVTKEVIVDSNLMNIQLESDISQLSEVIVSSTRRPVRKLETTTAVSVIGAKLIETARPEGFSEAIQGTPGVYTSQSQGRSRGSIFIRGFPDGSGNGLVYTGILIDGLPSLATTARPPDFAFGFDQNVERIEVVRGSAATLFGRASAAGVVNVISKVGGEELEGLVRLTNYSENVDSRSGFDYKVDVNLNGPINDKLRFNVGGFFLEDRGFRDLGYNDKGGQFRANFDYLMDKGSVRVYGGFTDMTIQNMIDIPYRLSDNTPLEGWEITDSYYSETLENYTHPTLNGALGIPPGNIQVNDIDGNPQNRSLRDSFEEGNYAEGINFGIKAEFELASWLIMSNNFRMQDYRHGTKFNLGVSDFYFNDPNNPELPVNFRIIIDGDGRDRDIMDELRFTIPLDIGNSKHNFNVGSYFSRGWYTPETYSWFHLSSADPDNPDLGFFAPLLDPNGDPIITPGGPIIVPTTVGGNPPPFGSAARRDRYRITVNSFFAGDEMKFAEKTTVNVGFRYDEVNMELEGFYDNPNDPNDAPDIGKRKESHNDISYSFGVNHLINEKTSVYGNFVSAFRMPDYAAYSPVDPESLETNPRIDENERITNFEVGYRTSVSDLGIDLAGFYTNIDNRLATVYEDGIAVQRPLGTNRIVGGEVALTYTPKIIPGLLVRGSFTYQKATFQEFKIALEDADPNGPDFGNPIQSEGQDSSGTEVFSIDLKGNQIPRIPSVIMNASVNYDQKYYGVNGTLNYFANRYADATNLYKQDNIANLNLGVYGKLPLNNNNSLKLNLLLKNVINTDKALRFLYVSNIDAALAKAQEIEAGTATAENTYYTGIPFLPRRLLISLSYEF